MIKHCRTGLLTKGILQSGKNTPLRPAGNVWKEKRASFLNKYPAFYQYRVELLQFSIELLQYRAELSRFNAVLVQYSTVLFQYSVVLL